jgi:hypothetical protein
MLDPVCKIQFLDRVVCSVDGSIVVHRAHLTLEYPALVALAWSEQA